MNDDMVGDANALKVGNVVPCNEKGEGSIRVGDVLYCTVGYHKLTNFCTHRKENIHCCYL